MSNTVICGNTSAGIVQAGDCNQMHLYVDDSKVLTVEHGVLKIYSRVSHMKGFDVSSGAAITLPLNGTLFHVTGTLTVENNATSPPTNTASILLNNSQNFQTQINSKSCI